MMIMILFHDSGYCRFKHFYLEKVCKQLRHLFPKVVSYNRIVELERDVVIPLTLFIKKVLLGKCTGISFVDSTPLRVCKNQRSRASMYKGPLTHSSHYSEFVELTLILRQGPHFVSCIDLMTLKLNLFRRSVVIDSLVY